MLSITSLIDINILLIGLSYKLALGWPKWFLGRLGIKRLLFCWPSLSPWLGLPVGETHLFVECCQAGGLHDVGELGRMLGQVLAPVTARYCGSSWIWSGTVNMEVCRQIWFIIFFRLKETCKKYTALTAEGLPQVEPILQIWSLQLQKLTKFFQMILTMKMCVFIVKI